jgi:hypothetical protein
LGDRYEHRVEFSMSPFSCVFISLFGFRDGLLAIHGGGIQG